ncbi:ABC transporter permease [Paenibacillus sp. HMSSN-139]|nr:ABC transporter permease [Paenibacillus sp. HMSSN-139]
MLQLIKLELKKGRLTSYLWGSLIAYIAIAGMMMLIYFVDGANIEEPAFRDYAELLSMIDLLVRATFIVYASVLLSKLIISEFKDKTIALLFAYPVNRKKLIFAKLTMVFVWTFVNVIVANLLIDLIMVGVNTVAGYLSDPLQAELLFNHGLHVLMQAFGAAGMSLLPLVAGLRKNRSPPPSYRLSPSWRLSAPTTLASASVPSSRYPCPLRHWASSLPTSAFAKLTGWMWAKAVNRAKSWGGVP